MTRIFSDFDGTITLQDVGDAMFEEFGGVGCREIVREYQSGNISAVECFRRECAACGTVNLSALHEFLDRQEIDSTFVDFVSFCRARQLELCLLSDGMDYYISRILGRHGVGDVRFFANTLRLIPVDGGSHVRFEAHFPYTDEVCDRCACCKRNHLLTMSADEDRIIYIGEGYSDRCPARFADVVFAKDELLKYCQAENISYYEYTSFGDIVERLQRLSGGERTEGSIAGLPRRRQAERARRDVFIGE
ncbi:MAG TPA: MtnX-like HAD-IB family phosphatase [Bacteroidota bacterium]|jgi:2,3-diketo-5-methylthio-1-phosphopentane phosphatase|nr:MtnX-like HAD-IB family phosphatase [Bacteroidota bacterium]